MSESESAFPPAPVQAPEVLLWEACYVEQLAEDATTGYRISIDEHATTAVDSGRLDLLDQDRVQAESYLLTAITPCHDARYYWEIHVAGHSAPIKTSRFQRLLREIRPEASLPALDVPKQRDEEGTT